MKKTKKNATLRIAVVLLAVTLLSTGLLGGTLAKYVSAGTTSDTARVAKWGVTITAASDADDFFKSQYDIEETDYNGSVTLAVESSNKTDKVLAPGTSGTLAAFSVTGTPEVASRLTFTVGAESKISDDWLYEGSKYEPVLWSLKVAGVEKLLAGNQSFDALLTELGNISAEFAPGTNLANSTDGVDSYVISWKWPFEVDGNDVKDTALGNLSAAPTINLDFGITITQID